MSGTPMTERTETGPHRCRIASFVSAPGAAGRQRLLQCTRFVASMRPSLYCGRAGSPPCCRRTAGKNRSHPWIRRCGQIRRPRPVEPSTGNASPSPSLGSKSRFASSLPTEAADGEWTRASRRVSTLALSVARWVPSSPRQARSSSLPFRYCPRLSQQRRPQQQTRFRGSITRLFHSLSTLHAAVADDYARLASGWQPTFTGWA